MTKSPAYLSDVSISYGGTIPSNMKDGPLDRHPHH